MCRLLRKSACPNTKMYLPASPSFQNSLAGASGLVLMYICIYKKAFLLICLSHPLKKGLQTLLFFKKIDKIKKPSNAEATLICE